MQVIFKLYATLTRLLPPGTSGHAVTLEVDENTVVQELIDQFNIDDQQAFLVMLNGVYIPPEQRKTQRLKEQDVLAIWPKVAGG